MNAAKATKQLRGKDIEEGTVIGTRRVREVLFQKGQWVYYSYDYLVVDDGPGNDNRVRWYRQGIPPVARIAVNKIIPPERDGLPK